jgi:hypothetical protein
MPSCNALRFVVPESMVNERGDRERRPRWDYFATRGPKVPSMCTIAAAARSFRF